MEEWKQTQYGNYEVSSYGNVRNTKTGNTLTNSLSKSNGYYKVTLTIGEKGNKKSKPIEVHRLVAETFLPQSDKSLVVDHIIENDKLNNRVDNLQWITQAENLKKAKRNAREPRLTKEQRNEVTKMYESGISLIKITIIMNEKYNRNTSRATYTKIVK
ncbi:HNH endonuclease [Serratia liquefaciens]|nr:HNH endonuclease [Serratia liquefaciens]